MQTNLLHQPENETLYYHTGTGSIWPKKLSSKKEYSEHV
jgi:hypothetical protein